MDGQSLQAPGWILLDAFSPPISMASPLLSWHPGLSLGKIWLSIPLRPQVYSLQALIYSKPRIPSCRYTIPLFHGSIFEVELSLILAHFWFMLFQFMPLLKQRTQEYPIP